MPLHNPLVGQSALPTHCRKGRRSPFKEVKAQEFAGGSLSFTGAVLSQNTGALSGVTMFISLYSPRQMQFR